MAARPLSSADVALSRGDVGPEGAEVVRDVLGRPVARWRGAWLAENGVYRRVHFAPDGTVVHWPEPAPDRR